MMIPNIYRYTAVCVSLLGSCAAYNPPRPNDKIIRHLFGEWSVWHSNFPNFVGSNKMRVHLYPERVIEVAQRKYSGPWLYEKRFRGTYNLSLNGDDDDINTSRDASVVSLRFHDVEKKLVSVFGIGLDDVPILVYQEKDDDHNIDMHLNIAGRDDLFLTAPLSVIQDMTEYTMPLNGSDDIICYHLVRSVRNDEPSPNVPISTFIATQILGTWICYILHYIFFHTFG